MRLAVVVALVLSAAAASCSTESAETLTVYSGRSEELVAPIIERFEEETGIDVSVRYAGSAEIAATVLEEGANTPADVIYTQDPASIGSLALAGILTELPADVLAAVPERFSDSDGYWVGISGRARVVVYDTNALTPDDLPPTEDGLTEPRWAGQVGIAPANGSFLAFVAAKILLDGEDATLQWLEGMAANDDPTFPSNSVIVTAVVDGQLESGMVNHYYLLRQLVEDPDAAAANYFFTEPTAGSLVMPAGAGIVAGTEHEEAALRFVEFLVSAEAQEYFSTETFEYPLAAGIAANPQLPPIDSIPTPAIDLSDLATVLDTATDLVAEAGLL